MAYKQQEGYPLMQTGAVQSDGQVYPNLHPQQPPNPPMPVVVQPGVIQSTNGSWMQAPQGIPNCPPGLEYLAQIDQLLVRQKVELLEVLTDFETKNKYLVTNTLGQKVYFAGEESDCCSRNCCGPIRPFQMKIIDNFGQQVINLHRPLACQNCCFPCCLQSMEISSPPGTIIGVVEQKWSIFTPKFVVKNASGDEMLRIEGPCCTCRCCADVKFHVYSLSGTKIGTISKQWTGIVKESLTDADNFGITFPADLDVKMKASLLGALFLIDMMYFESE